MDKKAVENRMLSIVIVTANRRPQLERCLTSLRNSLTDLHHEIIIVDNNSADDTVSWLKNCFPNVKLIENSMNRGVAPARNQALATAIGNFVLIIDDDASIIEGTFTDLMNFMDSDPSIGLVGARIIRPDGTEQDTKRGFPTPLIVFVRRLPLSRFKSLVSGLEFMRQHQLVGIDLSKPTEVNFVEGVFQMISRSALEKVGLLDATMFYGFEDTDYCVRMQKCNFRCFYYPYLTVCHEHAALTRRKPLQGLSLQMALSFIRYYRKHRRWIKIQNREQILRLSNNRSEVDDNDIQNDMTRSSTHGSSKK